MLNNDKLKQRPNTICSDCKKNCHRIERDYYMVKNRLWRKYGVRKNVLCMDCFEFRLGRQLKKSDFIKCFVNELNPVYQKLKNTKTQKMDLFRFFSLKK